MVETCIRYNEYVFFVLFYCTGDQRELHLLTLSFPTRRSSYLAVVMTFLPEANNMQISSMLPGTSFSAPARNSTQSAAASRICCRSPVVFTPIGSIPHSSPRSRPIFSGL